LAALKTDLEPVRFPARIPSPRSPSPMQPPHDCRGKLSRQAWGQGELGLLNWSPMLRSSSWRMHN